jgi:DNA helicase-2/ATP-dependent DNA helicase PcrA
LSDTVDPRQLQSRISHFKARNLSPQANALPIVQSTNPSTQQSHKRQKDIANDDFILLYESYQAALESSNLLDYDDILLRCLQMLKQHPMCVSNIQAVLIDEFQDTNVVQYELMKHFAWKQNCITVVGDPDQSIYGFRAAEIGNVRRMQKHYLDTLVVNLEENYRSSASILQAAMVVIQQDCQRVDKTLTATLPIGTSPVLRRMPTAAAEAEWIVGEIKRLEAITGNMIPMDGVAILVRSAHLTRLIETALTRHGLAYKMVGGTRFFDRAEVKIVIDYLRILQNPASNDALARVINVPSRKIGEQTIKQFLDEAEMKNNSLWDTIHRAVRGDTPSGVKISKPAEKGIVSFVWLILNARKRLNNGDGQNAELSLVEIVEYLLVKLDYQHYLKKEYPEEFDNRWANIGELIAQAREVSLDEDDALPMIDGVEQQAVAQKTVRAALEHFLANVALVNEKQQANQEEKVKEITITTIHAAKGNLLALYIT